jgi:hypothetical protein
MRTKNAMLPRSQRPEQAAIFANSTAKFIPILARSILQREMALGGAKLADSAQWFPGQRWLHIQLPEYHRQMLEHHTYEAFRSLNSHRSALRNPHAKAVSEPIRA